MKPCNEIIEEKEMTSTEFILHPMQSVHERNIYKSVRKAVLRIADFHSLWRDKFCDKNTSFCWNGSDLLRQTAIIRKANGIVASPVHIVLLNFTKRSHRFIIDDGHTILALLSVPSSDMSSDMSTREKEKEE